MAISRIKKEQLVQTYESFLKDSVNAVLIAQSGISVNAMNDLRKNMKRGGGRMMIVKKRLLIKSLEGTDSLEKINHNQIPGSLILIGSTDSAAPYAPFKIVSDYIKYIKKEDLSGTIDYVGGWIDQSWKNGDYIKEIANLPSKDELLSKLLFLLKYPVSSFARVISEVAKSK
ncbi:MAG TPA: 50S ribosomal protein L10 [Candidatus Absconditabacterales bacterium]|nr:50S ribosomal protein L10 [Candidatus Absconditabacterales bacterium]HNG97622.1 50S ribosomal protein L10 [Candidatus Absconditabacterales bacterium]